MIFPERNNLLNKKWHLNSDKYDRRIGESIRYALP